MTRRPAHAPSARSRSTWASLALLVCASCTPLHLQLLGPDAEPAVAWYERVPGRGCDSSQLRGEVIGWLTEECRPLAESVPCEEECLATLRAGGGGPGLAAYHPEFGFLGRTSHPDVWFQPERGRLLKVYDRPGLTAQLGAFVEGEAVFTLLVSHEGVRPDHFASLSHADALADVLRPVAELPEEKARALFAPLLEAADTNAVAELERALRAGALRDLFIELPPGGPLGRWQVELGSYAFVHGGELAGPYRSKLEGGSRWVDGGTLDFAHELRGLEAADFVEKLRRIRGALPNWPRRLERPAEELDGDRLAAWRALQPALGELMLEASSVEPEEQAEWKSAVRAWLTAKQVGVSDELAAFLTAENASRNVFVDGAITLDELRANNSSFAKFLVTPAAFVNESSTSTREEDVTTTTGGVALDRTREARLVGELDVVQRKLAALAAFGESRREAARGLVGYRCDDAGLRCRPVYQGGGEAGGSYWSARDRERDLRELDAQREALERQLALEREALARAATPEVTTTERRTFLVTKLRLRGRLELVLPDGTAVEIERVEDGSPARTDIYRLRRVVEDALREGVRLQIEQYLRRTTTASGAALDQLLERLPHTQ